MELPFDGSGGRMEAKIWVTQVERARNALNWTPLQGGLWAGLQLRGKAAQWLADADPKDVDTLDKLLEQFKLFFLPAWDQSELLQVLAGRDQAADETPREYWHSLAALFRDCRPLLPEKHQFHRFLAGLKPKAAAVVKLRRVDTVSAALTALEEVASILEPVQKMPNAAEGVQPPVDESDCAAGHEMAQRGAEKALGETAVSVSAVHGRGGEHTAKPQSWRKSHDGGAAQAPTGRFWRRKADSQGRARPSKSNRCHLCRSPDHFVPRCPYKPIGRAAVEEHKRNKGQETGTVKHSGSVQQGVAQVFRKKAVLVTRTGGDRAEDAKACSKFTRWRSRCPSGCGPTPGGVCGEVGSAVQCGVT